MIGIWDGTKHVERRPAALCVYAWFALGVDVYIAFGGFLLESMHLERVYLLLVPYEEIEILSKLRKLLSRVIPKGALTTYLLFIAHSICNTASILIASAYDFWEYF
jgi:hypothetical protein